MSRLWLVAAILGGLAALFALGGGATYVALNETRDVPGLIDDDEVIDLAERECRLMTSTVEGFPAGISAAGRLDLLDDQNAAIRKMVERIRSSEPGARKSDQPLDAWLADWETLASSRADYVDLRRRGIDADFRVPRSPDGDPISVRMDTAGEDVCEVPEILLRPDLVGTRPV